MSFTNPAGAATDAAEQYIGALLELLGDQDPFEVPKAIQQLTPRALDLRLKELYRPENLAVSVVQPK